MHIPTSLISLTRHTRKDGMRSDLMEVVRQGRALIEETRRSDNGFLEGLYGQLGKLKRGRGGGVGQGLRPGHGMGMRASKRGREVKMVPHGEHGGCWTARRVREGEEWGREFIYIWAGLGIRARKDGRRPNIVLTLLRWSSRAERS